MNKRTLLLAFLALAAAGAAVFLPEKSASDRELMVYCAAGLKKPVEAIAERYLKETGTHVRLQFGGTGTLLSQIQVSHKGDLFIAADDGSIADAKKKDVIAEVLPIALQHPVIAVKKGNPKGIQSLADLQKEDVRFALPNPEAASIGRVTKALLGDRWDALAAKAKVTKPTVTEIAADVTLGAVDAAIVWDATVPQFEELELVEASELAEHREHTSAALLSSCDQPSLAISFARYLSAPDRGGKTFAAMGFEPAGGDAWTAKPELILYSGGVNRPAIEKLVQEFADREGISVTTVFNGCGILCAAMKTMGDSTNPKFPDVYYACDVCFVPPVAEHFPDAVMLTETEIVIAVPKGNPKGIETLADLARDGLRVGLCNAEQSTLGYMTYSMLKSMNLWDKVSANASSQVPTADFLINQMRAGALDAAVVYGVNVAHQSEHFDAVHLPADKARAIQPFSVRKDSTHRYLGYRLLDYLRAHKESFENTGFLWTGDTQSVKSSEIVLPEWLKAPK